MVLPEAVGPLTGQDALYFCDFVAGAERAAFETRRIHDRQMMRGFALNRYRVQRSDVQSRFFQDFPHDGVRRILAAPDPAARETPWAAAPVSMPGDQHTPPVVPGDGDGPDDEMGVEPPHQSGSRPYWKARPQARPDPSPRERLDDRRQAVDWRPFPTRPRRPRVRFRSLRFPDRGLRRHAASRWARTRRRPACDYPAADRRARRTFGIGWQARRAGRLHGR